MIPARSKAANRFSRFEASSIGTTRATSLPRSVITTDLFCLTCRSISLRWVLASYMEYLFFTKEFYPHVVNLVK